MKVYIKEPKPQATLCAIWMHGLGADASDMIGLVERLSLEEVGIRHIFIDAPMRAVTLNNGMSMRAWYDIQGIKLTDREDEAGILQSQAIIQEVISEQEKAGFSPEKIILGGFSQGGAMALYIALNSLEILAGVVSLSAYLPLATTCQAHLAKQVPLFIARGQYDPLVLPNWTQQTESWLRAAGYNKLTSKSYLMEHAICSEEIDDLAAWLTCLAKGVKE